MSIKKFQKLIWGYYRESGRDLPWRRTKNAYHILASEMMLQQTQVARVLEFYPRFLKRFPSFETLAHARTSEVLKSWQGLGYNRRALALQQTAQKITGKKHKGKLPEVYEKLLELPGIGPATAGAILAYAWNQPSLFIETNIRRVFIHSFFPKQRRISDEAILKLVAKTVDRANPREWYWALMDYGTHLATLEQNPNRRSKNYRRQPSFIGSDRELRGKILRFLITHRFASVRQITREISEPPARIQKIISGLSKEGFLTRKHNIISFI